jgi:hypothetical protein
MRKIVHDEDEASMWINGDRLPDDRVVEACVMSFPEMLLRNNACGSALGHVGRMGGPNMELTSVAILVGKVELNEPVPMDGVAKLGVATRDEGGTNGLHIRNAMWGVRTHASRNGVVHLVQVPPQKSVPDWNILSI